MSTFQVVAEKGAEVAKLASGFITQAAASLLNKAESLSLAEMSARLDRALAALRGDEVPALGAAATMEKTPLGIAQGMVDSYSFNKKTGVSIFTVPTCVTDVEAMRSLNMYFRKHHSSFKRDAVFAKHLDWFERFPQEFPNHCRERDYSQARQITITRVVKGTKGANRITEQRVLTRASLVFADPRDQALAAAIHACKHNGEDPFKNLLLRGSVPGFAVFAHEFDGVRLRRCRDDSKVEVVAASGEPSSKLK